MARLATEEGNGTNSKVEIPTVLSRAQALGPENWPTQHQLSAYSGH